MFEFLKRLWRDPELGAFDGAASRETLIQAGRLVVIDDETPLLIEELEKQGFAVDHDKTGSDSRHIEGQLYDVAIVDYHGVGKRFGAQQGLDLLKHIRRVSPRTRLVAYTSRSLSAAESEFFRLSHAVLPKDLGLGDSLTIIESELRRAFSKEHLFEALVSKLNVGDAAEQKRLRSALVKALGRRDEMKFKDAVAKLAGKAGEKAVEIIVGHLFQGF